MSICGKRPHSHTYDSMIHSRVRRGSHCNMFYMPGGTWQRYKGGAQFIRGTFIGEPLAGGRALALGGILQKHTVDTTLPSTHTHV